MFTNPKIALYVSEFQIVMCFLEKPEQDFSKVKKSPEEVYRKLPGTSF